MISLQIVIGIVPIFIPAGGPSTTMTEQDAKVMIGIFIVVNIIWLISLLFVYSIMKMNNKGLKKIWRKSFVEMVDDFYISYILTRLMIIAWAIIIIVSFGIFISKFL